MGMLLILLEVVKEAAAQPATVDRSTTLMMYTRLHESETMSTDLGQFVSQIRVLRIQQVNETLNVEEANKLARNWVVTHPMKFVDLDKECLQSTEGKSRDNLFDRVAWDANGLMQSRYIKPISGSIYISTSYIETINNYDPLHKKNRRRNLLETLKVPYNATAFGNVTEEIAVDNAVIGPYDVCMENQYILEYKQMIYLCVELVTIPEITGSIYNHSIYFHRTGIERVYLFSLITYSNNRSNPADQTVYNPLVLDKRLGMVVSATNEQKLEIIAYVASTTTMAILTIDAVYASTPVIYTLKTPVLTLHYLANSLMVLTNANIQCFYLERYPGSSFLPETFQFIAAARFLKSSYSNEDTEIALEVITYSNFAVSQANKLEWPTKKFAWGRLPPVVHSLFSYNLITKQLRQVSQQIIAINMAPTMTGNLIHFYSFPALDGLAINYAARIFYRNNSTELRVGLLATVDAFTGFGATTSYNASYNFYITHAADELLTVSTAITPYRSVFTVAGRTARCELLVARFNGHWLHVRLNASATDTLPALTLDLYDLIYNRTVYTLHVQFLRSIDFQALKYQLWKGSELATYVMRPSYVQNQKIPLDQLVRGSFIALHNTKLPDSSFNYMSADLARVADVIRDCFFDVRSARIQGQTNLNTGLIKSALAIERVFEGKKSETVVFLQGSHFSEIAIYSVIGSEMVFRSFHPSLYAIKKTFMVSESYYLQLHTDGTLFGFDPLTYQLTVLNYPGSECLDMAEMFHPKLKPALLCLNRELQLVLYLIDQIVSKSFMNTRLNVRIEGPSDDLRAASLLYSSEFYPGRVFVLSPNARFTEPNLSTYYLEVEEFPVIRRLSRNFLPLKSFHEHLSSKVCSVVFCHDHLTVHFTSGSGKHWIGVYKMETDGGVVETKLYSLPDSLEIERSASLQLFYRHTQSMLLVNKDRPLVILACRLKEAQPRRNAMVINPFSPLLETVPVMLLAKHSATSNLLVFPYLTSSLRKQRLYSVGLIHYAYGAELLDRVSSEVTTHLLQFVDSCELAVKVTEATDSLSSKPLQAIFSGNIKEADSERVFTFKSQLDPSSKIFERNIKIEYLSLSKGVPKEKVQNLENRIIQVSEQMIKSSAREHMKNASITVFGMRFAEFFNRSSVFEMTLVPEGLYDYLLENIVLVKPLEPLGPPLRVGSTVGLFKMERFCRKYRLRDEGRRVECFKYGVVLFYPRHVQVFYHDSFALLSPAQGVRYEFNDAVCTENTVVNHTLMAVCMEGTKRTARLLDLIDLSVHSIESTIIDLVAIYPLISFPKTTRGFPETIVQYSKSLTDVRNQRGLSNNYYCVVYFHFDKQKVQRPMMNDLVPRVDFFNGFDSSITDTSIGAAYFPFGEVREYLLLNTVLASGSLVTLRLSVHANLTYYMVEYDLSNAQRQKENSTVQREFYFSTPSSQAIKNIIFAEGLLVNLLGARGDHVVQAGQEPRFHTLLLFPNYHSFLFSYKDFQKEQISIFRLHNPFSELLNQYVHREPSCYKWACILISLFDGQYYLRVYDMSFDKFGSAPPNFLENYPNASSTLDEQDKVDFFCDFEHVKEQYTLYPIVVKRFTELEHIDFHRTDEQPDDSERLTLAVFQLPDHLRLFEVNRSLRINIDNIYFSSRSLSLVLTLPFDSQARTLFSFTGYREADYFKYSLHIVAILTIGSSMIVLIYRWIKTESRVKLAQIDSDLDKPALQNAASLQEPEASPLLQNTN